MAGGVSKTFGILFVVLGVVAMLAGIGLAGYAFMEDQDQQEENMGLTYSGEEQEQNQMLAMGGVGLAALGLLALIAGIVLIAVGSGRSRNALVRDLTAGRQADAPAADDGEALAETQVLGGVRAKPIAIGAGVAFALVLLLAIPLFFGGGIAGIGGDDDDSTEARLVDSRTLSGTADGAAAGPLGSLSSGTTNIHTFSVPADATRLAAAMTWQAETGGAERLELVLEATDGSGGWTEVTEAAGASPVNATANVTPEASMRIRVFVSGDATGTISQDYSIAMEFWNR